MPETDRTRTHPSEASGASPKRIGRLVHRGELVTEGARAGFGVILERLLSSYGDPVRPTIVDPFQQILLQQVGYLASDQKRLKAFKLLRELVGLSPAQILAASHEDLLAAAYAGGAVAAAQRAERMCKSARLVQREWGGKLSRVLRIPEDEARRALAKFPMIGKPGADKILLFAGASKRPAWESNGLRVLVRIGYGSEEKSYDQTYKSVMEALDPEMGEEHSMVDAHVLLRTHGRLTCTRTDPQCGTCVLSDICEYALSPQEPRSEEGWRE